MVLLGFLLSAALAADPVSVAIMHSQTGTMSFSEIPVINAEILAIEEINAKGGVLGRQIAYKIFDGASIPTTFKLKAEQIVDNTSYVTTFGCWTSSSRKAVKPVFEAANALLWYPVHYEGQECSKNIFYSGATPNQQIEPSVNWLLEKYTAKQIFLVGSDYIFPRTVNTIVKAMLKQLGGDLVGEAYVPLPKDDAESASNNVMLRGYLVQLNATYPNGCVIYNSLHGDANVQLFAHMSDLGMGPDKYPTMSVLISEAETEPIGVSKLVGHYAAWNYFMTNTTFTDDTDYDVLSRSFIESYRARFGPIGLVNDPMEAAYTNVHMWALAVEKAQSFEVDKVRRAAYGIVFNAPGGPVTMQTNHHISKYARVGQVTASGLFDVVWSSNSTVYPVPWNQYINETAGLTCDHGPAIANCTAGTFVSAGTFASDWATFCSNCTAGTFSSVAGATFCSNCTAGQTSPSGATTCYSISALATTTTSAVPSNAFKKFSSPFSALLIVFLLL